MFLASKVHRWWWSLPARGPWLPKRVFRRLSAPWPAHSSAHSPFVCPPPFLFICVLFSTHSSGWSAQEASVCFQTVLLGVSDGGGQPVCLRSNYFGHYWKVPNRSLWWVPTQPSFEGYLCLNCSPGEQPDSTLPGGGGTSVPCRDPSWWLRRTSGVSVMGSEIITRCLWWVGTFSSLVLAASITQKHPFLNRAWNSSVAPRTRNSVNVFCLDVLWFEFHTFLN